MARKDVGMRVVGASIEVYGQVRGVTFSKAFPATTPRSHLRAWRQAEIERLRAQLPAAPTKGTLAQDCEAVCRREADERRQNLTILLAHWCDRFGDRSRHSLTTAEIQAQLDEWRAAGAASSTVNHRRQALITVYKKLDPGHPNPVQATTRHKEPEPEPRAIPEEIVARIFAVMPDSATKARLLVICHTGPRHSELRRVRREHVVLDGPTPHVYYSSGKGGRHRIVPLSPDGIHAFREIDKRDAWVAPKRWAAAARTVFQRACKRAGVDPDLYRPYDLRHRFATILRASGADLADVQALLGHRNITTTMRYAPVVAVKLVGAVNAIPALPSGTAPGTAA